MEQNNPNYSNRPQQPGNFGQQQNQQQQFQNQNQGNYQFPYQGEKLPADPGAITLGIISLVLFFIGCWCYGLIAVVTLILSIIGLVMANKSMKLYKADPTKYSQSSVKSVNIGKILNIVGVAISGLVCFILLIALIFFGSALFAAVNGEFDNFEDFQNQSEESIYNDEIEEKTDDTWEYYEDEVDSLNQEVDTVNMESIEIEEVIEESQTEN